MEKALLAVEQTEAAQPGVQQEVSTSHITSVATTEKPQYSYFRQTHVEILTPKDKGVRKWSLWEVLRS